LTTSSHEQADEGQAAYSVGWFGRLAVYVIRHSRRVLGLLFAITVVALGSASRLDVDSDILKLLPPDEQAVRDLRLLDAEQGLNVLTIAVSGATAEVRNQWLADIGLALEKLPEVESAMSTVDVNLAQRLGQLQLEVNELGEIRDRLKGAIALGGATNPFIATQLFALGPLTEKLDRDVEGELLEATPDVGRIVVRATGSATDLQFARAFMARVDEIIEAHDPAGQDLKILWQGGAYRHNVEDYEGIVQDLGRTSAGALLAVFLLISFAFRDPKAVLLLFTPLVIANIWTLGFAAVSVGTLNNFTSCCLAVLIGLGVDFGIHLFSRYREERIAGGTLEEAIARAWDRVGPPAAAAACTSSLGFFSLYLARFQGFQQLGLLLGVGVLICLTAVLVVLPLLIAWREKAPSPEPLRFMRTLKRRTPPTYRLAPLGLLLTLLVTLAAWLQVPNVSYEYDLSELRRVGLAYADLNETERKLARDSYAPLVASFEDEASLREAWEGARDAVDSGALDSIAEAVSVYSFLPPNQEDKLQVLSEISDLANHENARFLPQPVRENLESIRGADLTPLTVEDLPSPVRKLLSSDLGQQRMLLFPAGNMWDLRETAELYRQIRERFEDVPVAGQYLALGALYNVVEADKPKVVFAALLLVALSTAVYMRRKVHALLATGVLLAGMGWAAAMLAVLQIPISMASVVGIPILLGIGIDVVIHLLHRMAEEGPGRLLKALATTGWASGLSAATTILSFASLTLASSQGVQSLGQLVVVGLTAVTLCALLMLPLAWATVWKLGGLIPDADSAEQQAQD